MASQKTTADAIDVDTLNRCRTRLIELQTLGGDVCVLLRGMSRELRDSGCASSLAAIEQLARYRLGCEELSASISRIGIVVSDNDAANTDHSLEELQVELESLAVIRAMLERLDCLARIRHVDQTEFAPWQRCLTDEKKLREQVLSVPTVAARQTAEEFLSSPGPLNAIVILLADGAGLSDERWSMLLDSVTEAYGREICTAIARGKLVLTSHACA